MSFYFWIKQKHGAYLYRFVYLFTLFGNKRLSLFTQLDCSDAWHTAYYCNVEVEQPLMCHADLDLVHHRH